MLFLIRIRGCGRIARPAFPAPFVFMGQTAEQNSDASRRENAELYLNIIAV
jgi:hypothetical protein